jgi:hypothetical protein
VLSQLSVALLSEEFARSMPEMDAAGISLIAAKIISLPKMGSINRALHEFGAYEGGDNVVNSG